MTVHILVLQKGLYTNSNRPTSQKLMMRNNRLMSEGHFLSELPSSVTSSGAHWREFHANSSAPELPYLHTENVKLIVAHSIKLIFLHEI